MQLQHSKMGEAAPEVDAGLVSCYSYGLYSLTGDEIRIDVIPRKGN